MKINAASRDAHVRSRLPRNYLRLALKKAGWRTAIEGIVIRPSVTRYPRQFQIRENGLKRERRIVAAGSLVAAAKMRLHKVRDWRCLGRCPRRRRRIDIARIAARDIQVAVARQHCGEGRKDAQHAEISIAPTHPDLRLAEDSGDYHASDSIEIFGLATLTCRQRRKIPSPA